MSKLLGTKPCTKQEFNNFINKTGSLPPAQCKCSASNRSGPAALLHLKTCTAHSTSSTEKTICEWSFLWRCSA